MSAATPNLVPQEADYIEALADDLQGRGFKVCVTYLTETPSVKVESGVSTLSETVYAAAYGGRWWLWWSWGEPISPLAEASMAASKIARVLALRS